MKDIFIKINQFFAFTQKDRNGIYVLLFLIAATIALRTVHPFWKTQAQEFSNTDTVAAIAAGKAAFYGSSTRHTDGAYRSRYGNAHSDSNAVSSAKTKQSKSYSNNYTPPA
jgi:hypothetical protein